MPKLIRGPLRQIRTRIFDSGRWKDYQPRNDDIVIATYAKCGTTWTQRIVSMLIFGTAEVRNVWGLSPWPDMRIFGPIEQVLEAAQAQTHRRFLKTHLPYDAIPVYEGMKIIHVARDGRDAAMSLHNHLGSFTPGARELLDQISLGDPQFGDQYPEIPTEPAQFFHEWLLGREDRDGPNFFDLEKSYWAAREDSNMLLVHYADLKKDRGGEMRRIAEFLEIEIAESLWPELIEAASFDAMKRQGAELAPATLDMFEGGANRFFNKGTNGRWRDVFSKADLARYEQKVKTDFSPELARWVGHGRLEVDH